MLSVNLSQQTLCFLCSVVSGLTLGAIYVLFKVIRAIFHNRKVPVFILDVLYMLIFTIVTFLFSTGYTQGFVRYSVVFGEILGAVVFKLTLGNVFYRLFEFILVNLRKGVRFTQKIIRKFTKKLLKAWQQMLYNIEKKSSSKAIKRKGERKIEI